MTQKEIDALAENMLTFTQSAISVLGSDGRITKFKCPLCGGVAVAGRAGKDKHLFASCECGMRVQE